MAAAKSSDKKRAVLRRIDGAALSLCAVGVT
jgi:hypothetical protein